jgi:hypothetical protein
MMPPTARAQTPGPEPVNANVPPLVEPAVPLAVDGLVAVPFELACVALALDGCDPELGVGAGTKVIATLT